MTIKRLDHVSVVVDDLAAAVAFFTALGMTREGEAAVEGPWVDRINGLEGVRVDIVMMKSKLYPYAGNTHFSLCQPKC